MNERIKELAEQAGITFKPMIIDGVEYEYRHVDFNDNLAEDEAGCIELFIELIVQECMTVARKADGLDAEYEAWYLIKQHFGVEE